MKYSILFGGPGTMSTTDPVLFKTWVGIAEGIQALQKTDDEATTTYRLGDSSLPEDVRNDWNKIAGLLTT